MIRRDFLSVLASLPIVGVAGFRGHNITFRKGQIVPRSIMRAEPWRNQSTALWGTDVYLSREDGQLRIDATGDGALIEVSDCKYTKWTTPTRITAHLCDRLTFLRIKANSSYNEFRMGGFDVCHANAFIDLCR